MKDERAKVYEVRQCLTEIVETLSNRLCTDEVISELMVARKYHLSPYADQLYSMLEDVGVFKLDYFSELQMLIPNITVQQGIDTGLIDKNEVFLLKGRYCVPIRDISGLVTAVVGWLPDSNNARKYVTTPTYGFSKDGQFFNIECYEQSMMGDYPKAQGYEDSRGLVYLVEGIFDTLSLRALGFPALGNMGLDMSLIKTEILTRFGKVIAIPDNDTAGRGANTYLNRVSGKSSKASWQIQNENVIVQLPKGVKDVDDFIKGYYCLDDLLRCQTANYKVKLNVE